MDHKIIITAAVTGSFPTKVMNLAVPYTPEEIVKAAVDCYRAGAAITHVHVRDPKTGKPAYEIDLFRQVLEGIRSRCDMKGVLLSSNAQMVEIAADLAERLGRSMATPNEARRILGIPV